MFLDILRYIFIGLLLVLLQFYLVQEVNFGTWIKPLPYIYLLFILPFQSNKFLSLFIGFALGFFLDAISDTYGMHAAAGVSLAFIKHYVDKGLIDIDAIQLQGYSYLTPGWKGFRFYAVYTLLLIFIHHFIFFSLDYFKFSSFFLILAVSIFSTIVSFLFILLFLSVSGRR